MFAAGGSGSKQDFVNDNVVRLCAGLCQIVGRLHAHQRICLYSKGLLEPDCHFCRECGLALE